MKDINKIWREFLEEEETENHSCGCDQQEKPEEIWFSQLGEIMQDSTAVFQKGVKDRSGPPKLIVIHYTLTSSPGSTVAVLNKRGLSTHYEVDQDGKVHEYVDPGSKYTWHAGSTNRDSIGIDITSQGTSVQVEAVRRLFTRLCREFDIPQVVAPDNKKYTSSSHIQEAGVGIVRHRNLRPTACPGKFPMEVLGEPAEDIEDEPSLTPEEKEDTTFDLAKLFGFDKFGGFLDKITNFISDSVGIKSQTDIVNIFKQISSKMGLAEQQINENIKRFNNEKRNT